ncbi:terminase [Clostridium beijerinckii]|uniref:PBSX family phage terminase large subunit n=1 Tax=Clostridium beijerinckii TaxID=1520 RepID=A0AAX0AYI9_CLOBE|nr:terminase [Clostridium beijerinckii]NRT88115.1 PBSX family phage terminase large subunit [Clostridium beijerinckii]NYC73543.1 PBSX family phage terminase large subunit [Clostridium beijerinckii]
MKNNFPLSEKYIDFINTTENVDADFLEGTTASGKTTVGAGVKFMLMVSKSNKKLHIIASKTTGTAEKNIIQQDNGILDIHKGKARYCGNGDKDYKIPHIKFEDKIIFVLGYDNKEKWKLVLGSQFGCVYIDEINTADIEFIEEVSTRNDYLLATLNPDDPSLPVYSEFINRSRPYKKYKDDVPKEIIEELKEEPVPKWRYWFFTFYDNLSLTDEDIEKKKRSAPKGTKLYKNKIQGLRGRATGLIFSNFERKHNVIIKDQAKKMRFVQFTAALDTSYSQKSPDTFAMSFQGITDNKELVMLDEEVYSNKDLTVPLAPSDIAPKFFKFLEKNRKEWGFARDVFVDSADQATIMELKKYKRHNPNLYNIVNSYKKFEIIDRIHTMLGWINTDGKIYYYVVDTCKEHIREMEIYSWKEDKYEPEDANDHTINSGQYGWIPFRKMIGNYKEE